MIGGLRHGEYRRADGGLIPSTHLLEFEEFAKPTENCKILDLGCGLGRNYIELAKKGLQVYGAEINPEAAKQAQVEVKIENIRKELALPARLVVSDGNSLPFPDKTFDAIYSDCLHAGDIKNWNEAFRTIKDSGAIYIKLLYQFDFYRDEYKRFNRGTPVELVKSWFNVPGFDVEMREGVHNRDEYKARTHETKYLIVKMRKRPDQ